MLFFYRISASNYFGARHGIETLFQTIVWDEMSGAYFRLSNVTVEDKPEFPHRGLSLDTVRNFISIDKIKKVYTKYNLEALTFVI